MGLPAVIRDKIHDQVSTSDIVSQPVGGPPERLRGIIFDDRELNYDLRWPLSNEVYETMRWDPQVHGLTRAITLPITRTGRSLQGDDVNKDVMEAVRIELGLVDDKQGRPRRRDIGVDFDVFLSEVVTAFIFGHAVFEQVYSVGKPLPNQTMPNDQVAHIAKLAYIHPKVIQDWMIDRYGDLMGIKVSQWLPDGRLEQFSPISIDNLVVFANERVGANWWGTSIFRSLYKPWYLKDVAERVAAMAIERGAMGVPIVEYGPGGSKAIAESIGRNMRAGESAYVAIAMGSYKVDIIGARAAELVQPNEFIDVMKRDMSKALMAQIMDLGHSKGLGSGNLSEVFLEMFTSGVNGMCVMLESVITEHIIRDFVELNWGPDEPYPAFNFAPVTTSVAGDILAQLVTAGVITPDEDMESALRDRYGLPTLVPGARDKHAQQKADQAASAAKTMQEAVPPQPTQPGSGKPVGGGSKASPKALSSQSSLNELISFFNPYHDPGSGRFITGGGGGGVDYAIRMERGSGQIATIHTASGGVFGPHEVRIASTREDLLTPHQIQQTTDALAFLNNKFRAPQGIDVSVVAHDPVSVGRQVMKHSDNKIANADAWVARTIDPSFINFNSAVMSEKDNPSRVVQPNWMMPQRLVKGYFPYITAHEYGHAYDGQQSQVWPGGTRVHNLLKVATWNATKQHLSDYGRFYNQHEGYAEAFAEWSLSGGRTGNVAAQTFAREFGWPTP